MGQDQDPDIMKELSLALFVGKSGRDIEGDNRVCHDVEVELRRRGNVAKFG